MFDLRELLLRNHNQPAQIDLTTLKLLEEQLLQLLPPIVNALNATNILPLEPTWSKNEIAQKFKIIQKGGLKIGLFSCLLLLYKRKGHLHEPSYRGLRRGRFFLLAR